MTPLIYEKRDIKRMYSVGDRTLRRWVKECRFPRPLLPGRWDREQVDQWHAARCGQMRTSTDTASENNRQPDLRL